MVPVPRAHTTRSARESPQMSKPWSTLRRWGWRVARMGALVAIVAGVTYWVRFAPVSVTPHRIARGQIVAEVMGTGALEAHVKTTVSSKISGRIAEVLVDQGERVKQGRLLVRLDDEELRQQVAIAEANVEAAVAAVQRLNTDKARATAVYTQAETHHARVQALVERNVSTREELDKATELLSISQADLARAEAAITEGQKELIAAERTRQYHRARLADTEINAPFDGLIVRRQRDPGDVVVPGSSILTLISTNELWISAWVDETEMGKLKEEQPGRVVFRSESDRSYPGTVVRLGREVDRETREFIVDVRVLELPQNWAIGQRAETYIETARTASAVLLPAQYLVRRDDRPGVFVDRNGVAEWRVLTLGLRGTGMVEVVEGLQPGEVIVVPSDPRNSLRGGQRIVTR